MNARQEILERVRSALRTPTDRGVRNRIAPAAEKNALPQFRPFLPPVPLDHAGRRALFAAQLEALRAEFLPAATFDDLPRVLSDLARSAAWERVAAHHDDLVDRACLSVGVPVRWVDRSTGKEDLAACSAGITACEALVAQTGSVLLTSRACGGRALSVLPPHHVVIAQRDQLVGDLYEAYVLLAARFGRNLPSFATFVTGPSRTGDIEHVVVLGAHGPKRLTVVLVEND